MLEAQSIQLRLQPVRPSLLGVRPSPFGLEGGHEAAEGADLVVPDRTCVCGFLIRLGTSNATGEGRRTATNDGSGHDGHAGHMPKIRCHPDHLSRQRSPAGDMTDMTESLTPDDHAHLLRLDARARQRDSRARKAEREAAAARLVSEREAERLAILSAKDERIADLERRLADAEGRLAVTEQDLVDTRILLGIAVDLDEHTRRGMPPSSQIHVQKHFENVARRFEHATMRLWTCTSSEASRRAASVFDAALDRAARLPTSDDPVTVMRPVTPADTRVTQTVRNADWKMGIADRPQDGPEISAAEQAWLDRLGPSPYDPYEAMIEEIEHRAETGRGWDDDDLEDDDETRFADL